MSDKLSIAPLSRAIPAKMVKQKDSSKDRQNHDKKKKKKPFTDIIEEVEEEISEEYDSESKSSESESSQSKASETKVSEISTPKDISSPENKKIPPHFDGYA